MHAGGHTGISFIDLLPFFWFTISKLICDVNAMQHSMCCALFLNFVGVDEI